MPIDKFIGAGECPRNMQIANTGSRQTGANSEGRRTGRPGRRADQRNQQVSPSLPVTSLPNRPQARLLSKWPRPRDDEFLTVFVGGLGRIGMNWTLYGHAGRWLLVDAGMAFPEDGLEGVDAVVPDPASLRPILDKLDGLVVTHAHEDHIGAIASIWPDAIDCPIYASPFAAAAVSRKLEEAGGLADAEIVTFEVGSSFSVGPFDIRTVRMTHSVPEPVALAITTPAGTLLHTGDWKLDPEPLVGGAADLDALRDIGEAGVLAMVCDSTNADRDFVPGSEAQVGEAFKRLFASRKGIVAVSCFGTNVARMASASVAADATGRQIALAGRSLRTNEDIADSLGLLDHVPAFLPEVAHLQGLDRHETAIVCTGTQGEERAALARLARGDFRLPRLGRGDTVVVSARVIPGNEADVEAVLSKLRARGVEVLTGRDSIDGYPFHVSGHAGRSELKTLHALVKPRFALPVHGEAHHLEAHAALAMECGAEAAPVASEGDVVSVSARGVRTLGRLALPTMHLMNEEHGGRNKVRAQQPRRRHQPPRRKPDTGLTMGA